MTKQIAPRDEWPDLRVTLRPLPWTWKVKPRLYGDDVEGWQGHCSFEWLCLTVEWWANVPMFRPVASQPPKSAFVKSPITPIPSRDKPGESLPTE